VDPKDFKFLPNRVEADPTAWIAPNAVMVGDVRIGPDASVWYGCVLRGDMEPIRIGARTNIQDLTLVHVDRDCPAIIGDGVTVGHHAVIHGCTIGNDVLIGMGAVVLSGATVGDGALVAAGAVVREGFDVPPGMVAAGVPAKIRGEVTPELHRRILDGVETYVHYARRYREGELGGGRYGGEFSVTPGEPS
jgi:carbonic anhydrase/acetyltransferase-like protein (isoleucine patch superfamily)